MVNEFYFFTEWEGNSLPSSRPEPMVHSGTPCFERKRFVYNDLKIT
jgi:hypothetical protein